MDIPKTWKKTNLKDVVNYQKGKKPSVLQETEFVNSAPYLDIKALEKGEIRQYADLKSSILLDKTSVAMVWDGARSGWVSKGKFGALGSTLAALKPIETDVTYLYYFLKSQFEFINTNVRGIGIPHVDPDKIWTIQFPQAPIIEQKQISKKLDEIFSHLDLLNTRLDRIPELIKAFKEKVLTYAVTGKLTEEWRKKHKNTAHSDVSLIKENRKLLFEKKMSLYEAGVSGKPKQIRYDEYLGSSVVESWKRVFIEEIFDVETGSTPLRSNSEYWNNATIPWVKSGEVSNGYIFEVSEYISELAEKETNAKVFPINSILVAMYGEGKTRGQVGILKIEASTNQAIAALVNTELGEHTIKYVYYFGLSQYESIRKESVGGNQPNLNLNKIKKWQIDLPPFAEQKEIVKQVETLFAFADNVLSQYKKLESFIDNLPKLILTNAFKGALVK